MPEPDFVSNTRSSYDAIATEYADMFRTVLDDQPLDRALLTAFAEMVPDGPVLDVGSGPGLVTAFLRGRGLDVTGVDLSPAMVALARATCPDVPYRVGTMTALDVGEGALAGLVSWYSLIHIPARARADVLAGFHRALAPGGLLLLAFQVGDEPLRMREAFGRPVTLDFHRLRPGDIGALAEQAGLSVVSRHELEPLGQQSTPQAALFARRP